MHIFKRYLHFQLKISTQRKKLHLIQVTGIKVTNFTNVTNFSKQHHPSKGT
jgi:hypothetical protein